MPKFLIIRFSSIGDIIQCMDVVNGIKNKYPDAEIHWIARKDMSSFIGMDKRIDKIWVFDRKTGFSGLIKIAKELKKEKFDYIYDAHSNIRSNIIRTVIFSPFHKIIGGKPYFALRSKERGKRFLLFNFGINKFDKPFRGMVSYRKPLMKWGITNFTSDYHDWLFPEEYMDKFSGIINDNTITIVPSANWKMKRWPVEHWKRLVETLPQNNFIILAGPDDTFCQEIKEVAPERVNNLAGKTSLLESCYIVKNSNIVVSADTGFLHAADLFKVRGIALMGPTAFGFPTGEQIEIMGVKLPCRPCTKDGRGKCKQPVWQKCMVDITPEGVSATIKNIFNQVK